MAVINLLDKEVYELIAAGEVIERPASVIKELLENSVDAGASAITVEIKNGGRTFIRVTDNGCGMAYEDVPTAFLRHATSKVSRKADLDSIMTLGFRGEALASVCAVSKAELLTRQRGADFGTRYVIEGGAQKSYESAGCPEGTSIIIRDIFYNVPARLKFLKKDSTEANRIQELICRLAVSHPEISVKLIRDNKPVIVTAGDGKLYSAVYSVFGREFANSLLPSDYSREGISVSGFVSKPLMSRTNRKFQIFYVNDRYVRSEVCSQALEEAYRNSIMVGRFPACVLKINIPADMIDVNVHPAKTEIRFSDNRYVYDAVYFAAKQALNQKDEPVRMKIDTPKYFEVEKLFVPPEQPRSEQMVFAPVPVEEERGEVITVPVSTRPQDSEEGDLFLNSLGKDSWRGVLQPVINSPDPGEDFIKNAPSAAMGDSYSDEAFLKLCEEYDKENNLSPNIQDLPPTTDDTEELKYVRPEDFLKKERVQEQIVPERAAEETPKPIVVGELFKTYIIAQCGDDMIMIDKHAAHERYIFEQIKNDSRNLFSQILLDPIMVTLSYDEYDALAANTDKAEKLGFIIEPDTAPTIAVKGLPMILGGEDPADIISEIAGKLLLSERDPAPQFYDDLYHTIACKAAIKAHDDSKPQELQKLVDSIYGRDDIRYCPHGRPVMITMPKRDIEKQFKRIV